MSTATDIRRKIESFETMPVICQQLIKNMNNPDVDFGTLAEKIKYDPGMTMNILKLANSAYFGISKRVESLQTAIVMLGMKKLFQVVVAQKTTKHMLARMDGYDLLPEELLKHAVWTAVAAEEFSRVLRITTPELLFTAGLLHDIGKAVLDPFVAENRDALMDNASRHDMTFDMLERNILGMNHAEAGSELLKRWHFPQELEAVIRLHHEPESAGEHRMIVTIVHLADMLAYSQGVGTGIDGLKYRVSEEATQALGLRGKIVERVASQTLETMMELEKTLAQMM